MQGMRQRSEVEMNGSALATRRRGGKPRCSMLFGTIQALHRDRRGTVEIVSVPIIVYDAKNLEI